MDLMTWTTKGYFEMIVQKGKEMKSVSESF